jgi:hypothetical protein
MTETAETTTDDKADLIAQVANRQNDLLAELVEQNKRSREKPAETAPAKTPETTYSVQQLQAAVDAGEISQGQMISQLVYQGMNAVAGTLRQEYETKLASERARGSVETKLAAYTASYPELMDPKSDVRKKVVAALAVLAEEGDDPESPRTELKACRLALGEPVRKEPMKEQTSKRQRSVESTGSSGDRGKAAEPKGDGWPSWMSDRLVAHYEKEFARGRYPGKFENKDFKKELEFAKKKATAA